MILDSQDISSSQDRLEYLYTDEIQNFVSLPSSVQSGYNFEEKVLLQVKGYRPRMFVLGDVLESLQIKDTTIKKESLDFKLHLNVLGLFKKYYPGLKLKAPKEEYIDKLSIPRPLYSKGITYLQNKFKKAYNKINERNDLGSIKDILTYYIKNMGKQIEGIPSFSSQYIHEHGGEEGETYYDLRYYFSILMDFSKAMRDWTLDKYKDVEKLDPCQEFVSFNEEYLRLSMYQLEYLLLSHDKELDSEIITIETQKLLDNLANSHFNEYFDKLNKVDSKNSELIIMLLEEVRR